MTVDAFIEYTLSNKGGSKEASLVAKRMNELQKVFKNVTYLSPAYATS